MRIFRTSSAKAKMPDLTVSLNSKVRYQAMKDYYETKIKYLGGSDLSPYMLRLACWDAPIKMAELKSKRNRRLFVRQAKRFYEGQLKEINRKIKQI